MTKDDRTASTLAERNEGSLASNALVLPIGDRFDIVSARVALRQLAERQGLGLLQQLGISLATWSLMNTLELAKPYQGQITAECLDQGDRQALRVTCTRQSTNGHQIAEKEFDDMRWLVDGLTVEMPLPGTVRVTIIKWAHQEHAPDQQI